MTEHFYNVSKINNNKTLFSRLYKLINKKTKLFKINNRELSKFQLSFSKMPCLKFAFVKFNNKKNKFEIKIIENPFNYLGFICLMLLKCLSDKLF